MDYNIKNPEFQSYELNVEGQMSVKVIRETFDDCLTALLKQFPGWHQSRELSIIKTKLEEASMYAVKAASKLPKNQKIGGYDTDGS